jgi:acetoin utilization protein AcuB
MNVRQLMSRNVVTVGPSDSCLEAVARMHRARVRHLPVVDAMGDLIGVVTDRDLRHHLFDPRVYQQVGTIAVDILLKAVPVSDIMSSPVLSVESDDEVVEAARIMLEDKVGSFPVLENHRVVGIVTETDVLRQICRADQSCPPEVADIVVSYP